MESQNSIVSGIVYWLIAAIVMGILFIITGFLIIGIGYQVGKNLPEILLGYHQHYGGNNEYSYRNLLGRMDKICHSDKPHCTVTTCICGLYWNSMLCKRLARRAGILLRKTQGDVFIFLC